MVRVQNLGDTVQLDIEDQGIGIRAEERAGLFQPFFRAEQARSRGIAGLGLGLAVAARLARAFGATITVESSDGRGARFTVLLPRVQPAQRLGTGSPDMAVVSAADA
jgi:signal transduction histidine kinase